MNKQISKLFKQILEILKKSIINWNWLIGV